MNFARKIAGLGLFAALLWTVANAVVPAGAQSSQATVVGVDAVRAEPLTQTVPVIGRLVARRSGNVAAQAPGAVEKIHAEVGDHVKKGDVLAELDARTKSAELGVMKAQLLQVRADLESSRAQLTLAEQELVRQTKLKKSGAFSKSRFDTAQQEVLKAKARIARDEALIATRQASMALINLEIKRARITAPYDGVVIERLTETGSYLKNGDPVVKLMSDRRLEIEADVPAVRMPGLKPGAKVAARLEDGTQFTATVRAMLPVENPMTRTRPVRFVPQWPEGLTGLADSQSVTVQLPLGAAREIVTVHKDAIVRKLGENLVYVVSDGKAAERKVLLGEASGSRIEVVTGLKAGDLTVVRGNERLRPGASVTINKGS